jgi:hypothetical protein
MQRRHSYGVEEAEMILRLTHVRAYRECFAPTRSWGQGQARRRQGTRPGDRAPAKRPLRLVPDGKRHPDREPGGEQMVRGAVDRRTLEEES